MKTSVSFLKSIYGVEDTIKRINDTTCDYLHVDLMDGIFVNNKSDLGNILKYLPLSKKKLDVHLMMTKESIMKVLPEIIKLDIYCITIPIEIDNFLECYNYLKNQHINVGISINPNTNIDKLSLYLKDLFMVIVMSVNPGFGGQSFISSVTNKLSLLKEIKNKNNFSYIISVDGGINEKTINNVKDYADMVVSGSYICMADNYEKQLDKIRNN